MNRQALTETLAYFDENDQAFRMSDLRIYVAAARLVERLLPGECESCEGTRFAFFRGEQVACPVCHGSGRVWDEGIVEAVAEAVKAEGGWHNWRRSGLTLPGADLPDSFFNDIARAVLSALVELLTEKVPDALG